MPPEPVTGQRKVGKRPKMTDGANKARNLLEEAETTHDLFIGRVEDSYSAFRGWMDIRSGAAQWTSKLGPPYIGHIMETTVAALVDEKLRFKITPAPRLFDPGEFKRVREGAEAHEILHKQQLSADRFDEKTRPTVLQAAIAGVTPLKTYWKRSERERPELEITPLGEIVPVRRTRIDFLGPTTEVVDIRDFIWHEAATDIQRSPVVAHRVWMSWEELKEAERQGIFKNVDELKETREQTETGPQRSQSRNRVKDMIEVMEIWYRGENGIRVVTLANRNVEIRKDRPNPFWHGEYPFVTVSLQPDLFNVEGISLVEKIRALQEGAWDFLNQTLDNVHLINNAIVMYRNTVDDIDKFYYEPGAQWPVEDPGEAVMWSPDPTVSQVALPHINLLKQEMQNLAQAQPFTTTSEARNVGADTATEAALVSSIAQLATKQMKLQLQHAYKRVGQQRTELNKQFIREPILADQIGLDNQREFVEIAPMLLQGDYLFDITPMAESLQRQEKRAEANALFQLFLTGVGAQMSMAQAGAATPLNADEFWRELLEKYDLEDIDRFFGTVPAAPGPQVPGQPGQPAQNGGPGGVTAPQSIDPAVSPSNQTSISPEVFRQRALASQGVGNV